MEKILLESENGKVFNYRYVLYLSINAIGSVDRDGQGAVCVELLICCGLRWPRVRSIVTAEMRIGMLEVLGEGK